MPSPIYLDYNATTPVDGRVLDAMLPYFAERFGNPSSAHRYGREARAAVDRAREQVAELLGASPVEIVFTSGGSEAANTVFKGVAPSPSQLHAVTTAVEHPATLVPLTALARAGAIVDTLPVDADGCVLIDALTRAVAPGRHCLLSIMHANNEVGTVQPVAKLAERVHDLGGYVHVDAAQSAGKIAVQVDDLGADFLSVAAHKLYGPKGIGALYIRNGMSLPPLIEGAGHERGRRAGTESVPLAVGFGAAATLAATELESTRRHTEQAVRRLWNGLSQELNDLVRHGPSDPTARLPNTLAVGIPGITASELVTRIGDEVAISQGAACHADGVVRSTVLDAMGVSPDIQAGTVRLSVGRPTTDSDVDTAVRKLVEVVRALRS